MIRVIVLGAAAGGGFPQWNANSEACRRTRAGDPQAPSATQASIAVSGDDRHWFVLNAAPDLRIQIERTPALHPRHGLRSTPIAGVVLTGGEVDTLTGLLTLRESEPFHLFATDTVLRRLDANPIFEVVSRRLVPRLPLHVSVQQPLTGPHTSDSLLRLTPFAVPGKVPLYAEADMSAGAAPAGDAGPAGAAPDDGETIGLEITDGTRRLLFVPGCAMMTDEIRRRADGADCVFFDATLWRDDEMIVQGLGAKTGGRMGHMSVDGPGGVIESFRGLRIAHKILIHINNSNPLLLHDSPERQRAQDAGWLAARDGMELDL